MGQKNGFSNKGTVRKYGQILRVDLNSTSTSSVLALVGDFISCSVKFSIVTPNPEIILASQKDPQLLCALNAADLAIPDGVGLKLALPGLKIIKGRKLFLSLISLASRKDWRVFLFGGWGKEAEITKQKLEKIYRNLKIESSPGPVFDNNAKPVRQRDVLIEKDIIARINQFKPHLLFVGLGCPKQEKWIYKWLPKLNVGGAMTVGGTFRYLSGLAPLPPKWLEKAGLEWLWRVICEPKRLGRIFKAVIIFPLKLFTSKLSSG